VSERDPVSNPERLQELVDLGLTSSAKDPVLEGLAREVAQRVGLPTGLVSVVLDEAQLFAASHGLSGWMSEAQGTPVEWSFCAHAVRSREPFVVEDAAAHPQTRENPLVHGDGIRCYIGVPLVTSRGHAVGTVCAMGPAARTFSKEDLDAVRGLARAAIAHLETRRAR
jgi:GAF domain-containing protein